MLRGVLAVLAELREATNLGEVRTFLSATAIKDLTAKAEKIIQKNSDDAAAKGAPELAGHWLDILAELAEDSPGIFTGEKLADGSPEPTQEMKRVLEALVAKGYEYEAKGKKEFLYPPGRRPDDQKMSLLKQGLQDAKAAVKAAKTDQDRADASASVTQITKEIADLKKTGTFSKEPVELDPSEKPLKSTKEMKDLQKQIKAAEQEHAAATNASQRTAAEKKLADLEAQLDGETKTAQKAHDSGAAPKKKGATIKDPNDLAFNPEDPDAPPEAVRAYWKNKKVGAYKNTAAALAAVDEYEKSVRGILSVLSKDGEQKKFAADREARMIKLMKTLRDVVYSGEAALNKVGSAAEQPKKAVAEGLMGTSAALAALFEELKRGCWLGEKFVEVKNA